MKKVTEVTTAELIDIIYARKGSTFISVDTVTEPGMNKRGNPFFGGVLKYATRHCHLNYRYDNSVRNQLIREGKDPDEFFAKPRKWGTPDHNLVRHIPKGKGPEDERIYVHLKLNSITGTRFTFNGEDIDKSVLEPWLKKAKAPLTQEELDRKVLCNDIHVDGILRLRMDGKEYVVNNDVLRPEKVDTATPTTADAPF